jgi:hypothetical protein
VPVPLFTNNASTSLAVGIDDNDTTLTVADGSIFPSPSGGDWFPVTLEQSGNFEIVHCTARTGNDLTVSRAEEGTTPASFTPGARVDHRLTAATLDAIKSLAGGVQSIVQGDGIEVDDTDPLNPIIALAAALFVKLGFISVTQAVDLDEIEAKVDGLDAAVVLRGEWDASSGIFPGGGTAQAGWSYIVTAPGTVDGVAFKAKDRVIAITDDASTTTFAGNWFHSDYTDEVLSVAGKTGPVTLDAGDIGDGAAVSILGRAANSSGVRADIAAGANDRLLARVADAIAFVQLTIEMIPDALITFAKLASGAIATSTEYRSAAANKLLSAADVWGAAAFVTIADAATLTFDMSTFLSLIQTTLGGNRTVGDPASVKAGQHFMWKLTATGSTRTFALHADFKVATGVESFPISVTTTETVYVYGFGESADVVRITAVQRFA